MEKVRTAHSNFKKGLCDYNDGNDGGSVTHYLGNSEYPVKKEVEKNTQQLDGKEAQGNDHLEDFEDDIDFKNQGN
jgi:hypothetical protein